MKVGIVSFANPIAWNGGGELYTRELMKEGRDRSHEISLYAMWPTPSLPENRDQDIWIIIDVHNLPGFQRRIDQRVRRHLPTESRRFHSILDKARSQKFVHIDNAYVDSCDLGYLPCNGNVDGDLCTVVSGHQCHRISSREIYDDAKLCFFLSPLHREVHLRLHPGIADKSDVIRPTLDPLPFIEARTTAGVRDIDLLFAGAYTPAKGADTMATMAHLTIASPHPISRPFAGTAIIGTKPDAMASLYGRAKRFFFHPTWPEPFGRVIAEAALSGCELDVSGSIGALSFDLHPSDPVLYTGAAIDFWKTVESL
jgi:hypothetical protein